MLTVSVIIPTYNRPKEVGDCIRSILGQTVKPQEIILVDDGNLAAFPLQAECETAGIRCLYHKKSFPDLPESRNQGIRLAGGEIVVFLDDDTVLFPDFIEQILKPYDSDKEGAVGGVGGTVANLKRVGPEHWPRLFFETLFLVTGFREGTVLPSGFAIEFGKTPFPIRRMRRVDFLSGGVSSFRRKVFDEFQFTRGYDLVATGEDKDFTFRVSRKYRLFFNPDAKLYHYETPNMRANKRRQGRRALLARYLLFRMHKKRGWWSWLFFYYAACGYVLTHSMITLFSFNKGKFERLRGVCGALADIVRGEVEKEWAVKVERKQQAEGLSNAG